MGFFVVHMSHSSFEEGLIYVQVEHGHSPLAGRGGVGLLLLYLAALLFEVVLVADDAALLGDKSSVVIVEEGKRGLRASGSWNDPTLTDSSFAVDDEADKGDKFGFLSCSWSLRISC